MEALPNPHHTVAIRMYFLHHLNKPFFQFQRAMKRDEFKYQTNHHDTGHYFYQTLLHTHRRILYIIIKPSLIYIKSSKSAPIHQVCLITVYQWSCTLYNTPGKRERKRKRKERKKERQKKKESDITFFWSTYSHTKFIDRKKKN